MAVEAQLERKLKMLSARRELSGIFAAAYAALADEEMPSTLTLLQRARKYLQEGTRYAAKSLEIAERVSALEAELKELTFDLTHLADKLNFEPAEMAQLEKELLLIQKLKLKYGPDFSDVISYYETGKAKLVALDDSEFNFQALRQRQLELITEIADKAKALADARRAAGEKLQAAVIAELESLNMRGVKFVVEVQERSLESALPRDPQRVAFLLSANPGEPLQPLVAVASGGEASRILLALKTVLAEVDDIAVLIFDEIDRGISGDTTLRVAQKLQQIARHRQVLCVTHSPQIAAAAERHFLVTKNTVADTTTSELQLLTASERVAEVARLLTGEPDRERARDLATQLLTERTEVLD